MQCKKKYAPKQSSTGGVPTRMITKQRKQLIWGKAHVGVKLSRHNHAHRRNLLVPEILRFEAVASQYLLQCLTLQPTFTG